jgi:hypothetical protein
MHRLLSVFVASVLAHGAAAQTVWSPAAALSSQRVGVLKTNDVKPSVIWAGGSGGVYVSRDAGATWTLTTGSLPDPRHLGVPNRVMDVDRKNPDVVYAGVGQNRSGSALYRTSDGGTTWSAVYPPDRAGPDVLLALNPADPGQFYFLTNGYDSVCWGSTASPLLGNCSLPFGGVFAIDPTNAATLYSGTGPPIKSTDGGASWAFLPIPGLIITYARVDDAGVVWIGGYGLDPSSRSRARILKSSDGGATWLDLSAGLPERGEASAHVTVNEIAASPVNPAVLVAAISQKYGVTDAPHPESGFYRSIDGGAHWYRLGGYFEALSVAFAGANGETLVGGTAKDGVVTADANPPVAPVSVASITPTTGSTDGGTLVLVSGSGFTPGSSVEIGGQPTADFWFFDSSTIRVRTPAHAVGLGDVVVHNADGGFATLPRAFEFQDWARPANDPLSTCDSTQGLCLENGRFWVTVRRSGFAPTHPVALSQKSGYFWFDFSPSVEAVAKILDGRTYNGHYWIHWSALTDEALTVTVTDRLTMTSKAYEKPAGSSAAEIDKTSF